MEKISIIGLGYVGLPLATAFAAHALTVGYDVDAQRVRELREGYDRNHELSPEELQQAGLVFTNDESALDGSSVFIVTVPTPVDGARRPDLSYLDAASRTVGRHLQRGALVVYESTVYPGCTEEFCIPILEETSGLTCDADFDVGYSPERVNPGDPEHSLERIVKIVAGRRPEVTERMADLYGRIITAGIYRAPDIRTAEAAKVIENIQRDLNIALMNELSMLFHHMGLDTREVLKAASTKWNFLPFQPGLVGGHCIPVDPYYLTHKAQEIGFHPEIILAGRRINDGMGRYVARETLRLVARAGRLVRDARVLVLGLAFKEDVRDTRNSRVLDMIRELESFGFQVWVHDPILDEQSLECHGCRVVANPFETGEVWDAVILAVPHRPFRALDPLDVMGLLTDDGRPGVFIDVKGIFDPAAFPPDRVLYWRL